MWEQSSKKVLRGLILHFRRKLHQLPLQSQSRSHKHECHIRREVPFKSQMSSHKRASLIRPHIPLKSQMSSHKHVYQMRPLLLLKSQITSHYGGSRNRTQVPFKSQMSSQKYGSLGHPPFAAPFPCRPKHSSGTTFLCICSFSVPERCPKAGPGGEPRKRLFNTLELLASPRVQYTFFLNFLYTCTSVRRNLHPIFAHTSHLSPNSSPTNMDPIFVDSTEPIEVPHEFAET